ncbi:Fatty acid amide hydrolase 1, partial [Armadillidium vulgare]
FINSISAAAIYSAMFNYFDFPSGAIIVTNETEEDQVQLENYSERDRLFYLAKQSAKGATGLPIGVLISGRPWEEELVCRGMKELEEALKLRCS